MWMKIFLGTPVLDKGEWMWMECDDLKSDTCSFKYMELPIPPDEIHIVMWERIDKICFPQLSHMIEDMLLEKMTFKPNNIGEMITQDIGSTNSHLINANKIHQLVDLKNIAYRKHGVVTDPLIKQSESCKDEICRNYLINSNQDLFDDHVVNGKDFCSIDINKQNNSADSKIINNYVNFECEKDLYIKDNMSLNANMNVPEKDELNGICPILNLNVTKHFNNNLDTFIDKPKMENEISLNKTYELKCNCNISTLNTNVKFNSLNNNSETQSCSNFLTRDDNNIESSIRGILNNMRDIDITLPVTYKSDIMKVNTICVNTPLQAKFFNANNYSADNILINNISKNVGNNFKLDKVLSKGNLNIDTQNNMNLRMDYKIAVQDQLTNISINNINSKVISLNNENLENLSIKGTSPSFYFYEQKVIDSAPKILMPQCSLIDPISIMTYNRSLGNANNQSLNFINAISPLTCSNLITTLPSHSNSYFNTLNDDSNMNSSKSNNVTNTISQESPCISSYKIHNLNNKFSNIEILKTDKGLKTNSIIGNKYISSTCSNLDQYLTTSSNEVSNSSITNINTNSSDSSLNHVSKKIFKGIEDICHKDLTSHIIQILPNDIQSINSNQVISKKCERYIFSQKLKKGKYAKAINYDIIDNYPNSKIDFSNNINSDNLINFYDKSGKRKFPIVSTASEEERIKRIKEKLDMMKRGYVPPVNKEDIITLPLHIRDSPIKKTEESIIGKKNIEKNTRNKITQLKKDNAESKKSKVLPTSFFDPYELLLSGIKPDISKNPLKPTYQGYIPKAQRTVEIPSKLRKVCFQESKDSMGLNIFPTSDINNGIEVLNHKTTNIFDKSKIFINSSGNEVIEANEIQSNCNLMKKNICKIQKDLLDTNQSDFNINIDHKMSQSSISYSNNNGIYESSNNQDSSVINMKDIELDTFLNELLKTDTNFLNVGDKKTDKDMDFNLICSSDNLADLSSYKKDNDTNNLSSIDAYLINENFSTNLNFNNMLDTEFKFTHQKNSTFDLLSNNCDSKPVFDISVDLDFMTEEMNWMDSCILDNF